MTLKRLINRWLAVLLILVSHSLYAIEISSLEEEVRKAETAFAKTMADRDFEAFKSFLDDEAVFLNSRGALRGKEAIAAEWKSLYEEKNAPFSWKPETVVVVASGTLAYSTGPVSNEAGKVFSYYTSVWRKASDGRWKVVLDKGQKYCPQ